MSDLDVFSEVYGSATNAAAPVTAGNPTVIKMNDDSDIFNQVYSAPSQTSGLNAASGQIGKGLAFGFFDEIQGAEVGLRNLLGIGNGETYDQKVAELRAADNAYEAANPKTSIGLQMLGALAPTLASGGVGLATRGAAKLAPSVATSALKNLYGVGITQSPSVARLALTGGFQGGLYGAGEANEGDRLTGAGIGGTVGAVLSPVIGKGLEKAIGGVGNYLAEKGLIGGKSVLSTGGQRGSVSNAPSNVSSLTPEEIYVARQLKNTPLSEAVIGADELGAAVASDVPLFLPDAIQSADLSRNAKFIANNKVSMRFAQGAISARKEGAGTRIETLLSDFAPHVDPTDAGTTLINASENAVNALKKVRTDVTEPLYKALQGQAVPDEVAIGLLDDPVIEAAVDAVSKSPVYQKELGKASPQSFKYLQLTKEKLTDQVDSLVRSGSNNEARIVGQSRDKVVKALETLDEYKKANALYRDLSKPINRLAGTKDEAGLLEGILNTDRINAYKAPAELLKRTPAQILEIKATLGDKGQEELSKSARSLMQDILEKANEQNQPALKLLQNDQMKNKFFAMIGEDAYQKFASALDLEKRMARANNLYAAGSPTAGYLQEENAFEKSVGLLSKFNPANWRETLASMFSSDMPEDLAQKVAKIYFDPKAGKQAVDKILPLLKQYAANKSFSEAVGKGAAVTSARAGDLLQKPKGAEPVKRQQFEAAIKPQAEVPEVKLTPVPSQLNNLDKTARIKKTADFVKSQPPLIQAVILTESSGDPFAQSPTGPIGLTQLTSYIAKRFDVKDRLDPKENVRGGTEFLQFLADKYDDPKVILTAYNQGEPVVDAAIRKAKLKTKTADFDSIKDFLPTDEGKTYADKVIKNLNKITGV